ncbi:hypothetical protein OPQ81_000088 [Rhizoctonia solani]|nr:hypothetical protein OPQ81_000088 [Rhizoctonia solani]
MAKPPTPGEGDGIEAFFQRCGAPPDTKYQCRALAAHLFPGARTEEVTPQGYCSYTLYVGADQVLQFRPPAHRLDVDLAEEACAIYGNLAPETRLLTVMSPSSPASVTPLVVQLRSDPKDDTRPADEGIAIVDEEDSHKPTQTSLEFDVIYMKRTQGISLAEHRASSARVPLSPAQLTRQREALVAQFARFIATGWDHGRRAGPAAVPNEPALVPGKVGRSMRWRLEQMRAGLPRRFGPVVGETLARLDEIVTELPWMLTHGDVVPGNVVVSEAVEETP